MYDLVGLKKVVKNWVKSDGLRGSARRHGIPISMIRTFLSDRSPNLDTLEKIAKAADWTSLTLDFKQKPDNPKQFSATNELPNHGLAKCGIVGWFNDRDDGSLPAPEGLNDPDAFYVRATGLSMRPEGIPSGSFCLISPQTGVKTGDRVYVLDDDEKVSVKRLIDEDDKSYTLRGWMSPEGGRQTNYEDQRFKTGIVKIAPVIAVIKNRPEPSEQIEYVDDPRQHEFAPESFQPAGWRIPENTDTVRLYGYAGAGGEIAYDGELHHGEMASAPPGESKYLAAVEVRGDSAAPYLREGDRIYFNPDFPANPEQHIGRLVLATTTGGAAYIKILRRGDTEGKWNLQSINPRHPLMEDVELQRISPFVWIHYNGRETPFKKM